MKELILHCGIPKSGSSSIQHTLMSNYELLIKENLLYPIAGREYPRSPAQYGLWQEMKSSVTEGKSKELISIANQIKHEAEESNCSRVVLSCEMLAFISNKNTWQLFLDRINASVVRFVFYMRDEEEWLKSWHRQSVKFDFSTLTLRQFSVKTSFPFQRAINNARALVGDNAVETYSYERIKSTKEGLLNHFLSEVLKVKTCGIQIDEAQNVTPTIEQLVLLKRINQIEGLDRKKRRAIASAIMTRVTKTDEADFI